MKLLQLHINSIMENENKDLKINYDMSIDDNQCEYYVRNMDAIFNYKMDVLESVERPCGMRIDTATKSILKYLIDNNYIDKKGE